MKLKHLDHINIVVTDLKAAKSFFLDLGFEIQAEKTLEGAWIDILVGLTNVKTNFISLSLPDSQAVIELLEYIEPKGGIDHNLGIANQVGYRHIAFQVEDIDAWYTQLGEKGVERLSPVQSVPNFNGKRLFYFRGPDNILLEFMEYTKSID
jgi:catechol 2,3-dioxygenase-like lactoylglutathione lyase family enzyme